MAGQCARLWTEGRSVDLTLVGRDAQRTEQVASSLRGLSTQSDIRVLTGNFLDPAWIQLAVDGIFARGPVDIAMIAHGWRAEQDDCQNDLTVCRNVLEVNGISPVLFAEAFAFHMERANHGSLAIIGSVSGDRARKRNYVYGSAKGLVARYVEGMQHRFAGTGVNVILIKPGPTDTPMASHVKAQGKGPASVASVAKAISKGIARNRRELYVPWKWKPLMFVVRHIPFCFFKHVNV